MQRKLRAFHDEVLGAGALPLKVLEERIARWIARRLPAAAGNETRNSVFPE